MNMLIISHLKLLRHPVAAVLPGTFSHGDVVCERFGCMAQRQEPHYLQSGWQQDTVGYCCVIANSCNQEHAGLRQCHVWNDQAHEL